MFKSKRSFIDFSFFFFLLFLFVSLFTSCGEDHKSPFLNNFVSASKISEEYIINIGLPVLDITTTNSIEPTCDYIQPPFGGRGVGITNNKYVTGQLKIYKSGELIYDSGKYEKNKSGIKIKIRGNSSAYGEKKPYKIKLSQKSDLLFRKNTNKNSFAETAWVLLKDPSLNTIVGMKTASFCGVSWTPDFLHVNVFLNGDYKGLYLLGDSVERGYRRCNVSEEGFIIEDDSYWWKEKNYFETAKGCKYTFKHPDKDEVTPAQIANIKAAVQKVETALAEKRNYSNLIDEDSFVSWLLTHDLLGSWDNLGSNIFIAKYDNSDSSKIFMTTPWDFDFIYITANEWSKIHDSSFFYFDYLLRYDSFKKAYKAKLAEIEKKDFQKYIYAELYDLCMIKGDAINESRVIDAERWNTEPLITLEEDIVLVKEWFAERFDWLENEVKSW